MSKVEYRAVIKFLSKEGLAPAATKQCVDDVYDEASLSYSTVKELSKQFLLGRESVEDEPREGRPMEVVTEENIRCVEEELLRDRRLTLKEISARLGIPKTTVIRIIHEHLHVKKVSAIWVPILLSSVQKEHHLTCCQKILELFHGNQKQVLESIVTGDETMVLYYDPLTKSESMEWHKPGEALPRKAKVTQSAKKIMATIFWDCRGILLIDFKDRNTTVNAAYCAPLMHKLHDTIKEKRRGMLSRGVHLLHDNAAVHTVAVAKAAVKECGFEEIEHPPYSPDLAPSDYYLFSKLKKDLRGKKFDDEEEVTTAVMEHFADKEPEHFLKGIELLVQRCEKCVEIKGDHIEKWQSCFISVTLKSWSGRKFLDPTTYILKIFESKSNNNL